MKILKKVLIFALLTLLLAASAAADIIVEPDDDFWKEHESDCEYYYRAYTVNGAQGYAALWESPASSRQREVLSNGEQVGGQWHYADGAGETWCAIGSGEWTEDGYEKLRGWVRESDCAVVPDHISFQEAHEAEFVANDGSCDAQIAAASQVVLWKYPGSGVIVETVDAEWFQNGSIGDWFETCWRDGEGRLWGLCGYCYGYRSTWVCLSDPENEAIPADPDVLPEQPPLIPAASTLPTPGSGVSALAIGAVAAVVALSVLLIGLFFSKKRRGGQEAA